MKMAELKPVYIADNDDIRIVLDGPVLGILGLPGIPLRQIPLRLISRLVILGEPRVTMSVLLACMDAGIPVTFLTRKGVLRACCLPAAVRGAEINDLLHDFIATAGWQERFADWMRAFERRAQNEALERFALERGGRPADAMRLIARAIVRRERAGGELVAPRLRFVRRRLEALLDGHLPQLLAEAGIAARFQGYRGVPLNLLAEMRTVLGWYLWWPAAQLVPHLGHGRAKFRSPRAVQLGIVRQYEAHSPFINHRFRAAMASFSAMLYEFLP